MTDHDLATLLREHIAHDEPPFLMSAHTAIAVGRRTLVRRRVRRGFVGVLVAAAAVTAVPLLPWSGSGGVDRTGIDPATAAALDHYDARRMPAVIDEHVRVALGDGLEGMGAPTFAARDSQEHRLSEQQYDRASSMVMEYGGTGPHRVRVYLGHARSEAEGDRVTLCNEELEYGSAFRCEVSRTAEGDVVTTNVSAVRVLHGTRSMDGTWGSVTREELLTGRPVATNPSQQPIDPDEVYFMRTVEVVHSATFVTTAQEYVKAPSLAAADAAWRVPTASLEKVATDPELVIPEPSHDRGTCSSSLPDAGELQSSDPTSIAGLIEAARKGDVAGAELDTSCQEPGTR